MVAGKWRRLPSLSDGRHSAGAAYDGDETILVCGGTGTAVRSYLASCEAFNLTQGRFAPRRFARLTIGRTDLKVAWIDDTWFAMGGYGRRSGYEKSIEVFGDGEWRLSDMELPEPMDDFALVKHNKIIA